MQEKWRVARVGVSDFARRKNEETEMGTFADCGFSLRVNSRSEKEEKVVKV
jgi:hypothetical protein